MEVLNFKQVKGILEKLENKSQQIKAKEVYLKANDLNLNLQMVSKIIEKLKTKGEIYEPRKGIYVFLVN